MSPVLFREGISINTAGQTLDNRRGTLNSLQELTVSTGAMDNRGGTVGRKRQLT
ncbi:hypothetical protein [Escherichia coli]|uniref:hypothetical protein n=1 Tax=Escherichia coli TaxID=562 RepID=UPI0029D41C86|nr:hypothetical protein [Escherichia coli]